MSISYINSDSNNNNKSVNIFILFWDGICAFFWCGPPRFFHTCICSRSTHRRPSLSFCHYLTLSLYQCKDLNKFQKCTLYCTFTAFCLCVLYSLLLPLCHYTISITDLFFNWLCYHFFLAYFLISPFSISISTLFFFFAFLFMFTWIVIVSCLFGVQCTCVIFIWILLHFCLFAVCEQCSQFSSSFIHSIHCILKRN